MMTPRLALLTALVPSCAPWVFQSLDRDCEAFDDVVAATSTSMSVHHRASRSGLAFDAIDQEEGCWVSARGEQGPPIFEQDAQTIRVRGAESVHVYGDTPLAVQWEAGAGMSTIENELGTIRGEGPATMNFKPYSVDDTVRIDCPDCNVELYIPAGVAIGTLTAATVSLCFEVVPTESLSIDAQQLYIEFADGNPPIGAPAEDAPPPDEPIDELTLPCWR